MHSTNYTDAIILTSEDCPARAPLVPPRAGTVAALQYELLAASPYQMTSDDLLFEVFAERTGIAEDLRAERRDEFFSRPQACLRSSPLVKTYGWALHHDSGARVALVDPNGKAFEQLVANRTVAKINGMRSRRAG